MEDQNTVGQWALQTFGKPNALAILRRMVDEIIEAMELCTYESSYTTSLFNSMKISLRDIEHEALPDDKLDILAPSIAKEVADAMIVAYHAGAILNADLAKEITDKMQINRARKWKIQANGTGKHIKESENE